MAKAKRESKYTQKLKKELVNYHRQFVRKYKKDCFQKALAKEKVESNLDVISLSYGLSHKALVSAAYLRILELSYQGYSPAEIIEAMKPKKAKQKNDNSTSGNVATDSIDKEQNALTATTEETNQNSDKKE